MAHIVKGISVVRLPLKTRAGIFLLSSIQAGSDMDVLTLRERRDKANALPVSHWIIGKRHRDVTVTELSIPTRAGQSRSLVYTPLDRHENAPIVVNYHGGGFVFGEPEQSDWLSSMIAARTGATVISPSYRLAPEHPFPAAVEDTWDTLEWIANNTASLVGAAGPLILLGTSAGGNLAAGAALQARDRGLPLAAQVLVFPAITLCDMVPSEFQYANGPMLSRDAIYQYLGMYCDETESTLPLVSPLHAESHAGLPRTLVINAEADPLRDHGGWYHQKLVDAGVDSTRLLYDQAVHGFTAMPGLVPQAQNAANDIARFIKNVLGDCDAAAGTLAASTAREYEASAL